MVRRQVVVFEDENDQQALLAGELLNGEAQQRPGEPDPGEQPPEEPTPIPPQPEPDEEDPADDDEQGLGDEENPQEPTPRAEPDVVYPAPFNPPSGDILGPNTVTYEQRIRVVEAYQYHGRLSDAPTWVDRNWAAWGEYDPLRSIQPGPSVRVPGPTESSAAIARIGDYIVQQEVTIAPGITDLKIEVWAKEQFERFFLPVHQQNQMVSA